MIVISGVEIADLKILVHDYADMPDVDCYGEPVRAAESVVRGLAAHPDRVEIFPPCHSLSTDPEGFDGGADCQACLEKLTCIVALHRLGQGRPKIYAQGREYEPLAPEDASFAVPLHPPIREVTGDDLSAYTDREVRAKAESLGIVTEGVGRAAIEESIRIEVAGTVGVIVEVEQQSDPMVSDVESWRTLYHRRRGRTITCRVLTTAGATHYEVLGQRHSTLREAAAAAFRELEGRDPQRINPEKFWSENI